MTVSTKQTFEEVEWHDAEILSVSIDRREPGQRDEVALLVRLSDDRTREIRFRECYAFEAQMNFGVVAAESIGRAGCVQQSPRLAEIVQLWKSLGVDLGNLKCYEFTTNSTASIIRVFARWCDVS